MDKKYIEIGAKFTLPFLDSGINNLKRYGTNKYNFSTDSWVIPEFTIKGVLVETNLGKDPFVFNEDEINELFPVATKIPKIILQPGLKGDKKVIFFRDRDTKEIIDSVLSDDSPLYTAIWNAFQNK